LRKNIGASIKDAVGSIFKGGEITPADQQKALRELLQMSQDTPTTPLSTATRQPVQKTSSPNSTTERGMINPSAIASDIKAGARKAVDYVKKKVDFGNPEKERGMINVGAMADDLKGGATLTKKQIVERLRKTTTEATKQEMADFVDVVKSGRMKTDRNGNITFASKADEDAFDIGISLINSRPMLYDTFAMKSPGDIANLFDEALNSGNPTKVKKK